MKANLLLDDPKGVLDGFVNIDPLSPASDATRVTCDPGNLQGVCDAGELTELRAMGILDYFPHTKGLEVLRHWISRLSHGGVLTASFTDIYEVARNLHHRAISLQEANDLLHGEQTKQWNFRHATYSIPSVCETLSLLGMKIIKARLDHFNAIIVGERK